ncbi:MAG: hypothetical protein V1858_00585 [Candidatus Gottesmanbacteria bacterium]
MIYQIDQSGKIEDTSKPTVLALSNSKTYSIFISAKVKREIQEIYRRHGLTRFYIYETFSLGIYFLLRHLKEKVEVVIDVEYEGWDKLISQLISIFLKTNKKPAHEISFAYIGNTPKVHYAAHDVFVKKNRPDRTITKEEILQELKKTGGRLRECLSTLVDARPQSYRRIIAQKPKKSR